jgi:uncharacterized protein YraI
MQRAMFTVAFGLLILFSGEARAESFAVEVTSGTLNVRNGVWGSRLATVDRGDRFVVLDEDSGWFEIQWAGRSGWVSGSYVRRVNASAVRIDVAGLNVRTGPSTGYGIFGVVARGQSYVVTERSGDWVRIQFDRRTAWVAGWLTSPRDLGAGSSNAPANRPTTAPTPTVSTSGGTNPRVNATQEELEILARICKGEAGVASYENKVAVCAVVLNRVRSRRHPNTIRGVAHQPWQFSCYNADVRQRLYYGPIPSDCWAAAREALGGRDPSLGATFYFNPFLVLPSWSRNMTFLVRIGSTARDAHDFYKP